MKNLRKHWFLLSILFSISIAYHFPWIGVKRGPLKPEWTVKIFAVCLIFFFSGLSLQLTDLQKVLFQWRLHIFIQSYSLLFTPVFVIFIVLFIPIFSHDIDLSRGFITLSCMPPPVSSAVILTKAVGGNEAAAVFNSILGSFLGVFITPLTLFLMLGASTSVPFTKVLSNLLLTVILPLIFGQMFRNHLTQTLMKTLQSKISVTGQSCLILIIFSTFCDTFDSTTTEHFNASVILLNICLVMMMQLGSMMLLYRSSTWISWFSPEDTVCIIFCGVHKSLTLGMPMLKILFEDSPHLAALSLPLLIYHPTQILLGGLLAPYLKSLIICRTR